MLHPIDLGLYENPTHMRGQIVTQDYLPKSTLIDIGIIQNTPIILAYARDSGWRLDRVAETHIRGLCDVDDTDIKLPRSICVVKRLHKAIHDAIKDRHKPTIMAIKYALDNQIQHNNHDIKISDVEKKIFILDNPKRLEMIKLIDIPDVLHDLIFEYMQLKRIRQESIIDNVVLQPVPGQFVITAIGQIQKPFHLIENLYNQTYICLDESIANQVKHTLRTFKFPYARSPELYNWH